MATLGLFLLWCGAGLAGLHFGGVRPESSPISWVDAFYAALFGPFSFLLAGLAAHMTQEDEPDSEIAERRLRPRGTRR